MKQTKTSRSFKNISFAIAALAIANSAHADISEFATPAFRGTTGSTSAYWETFTSAYGGANAANGVAPGGSLLANATVTQTQDPGAFLTGGGNIYDFAAPTGFTLSDSISGSIGQVVLQTRTLGNELDYSSVLLTYITSGGSTTIPAVQTVLTDNAGGDSEEWIWNLSNVGNVSSLSIAFDASAPSTSMDSVAFDVQTVQGVPEPGVISLLGLGAAGFAGVRRFRWS